MSNVEPGSTGMVPVPRPKVIYEPEDKWIPVPTVWAALPPTAHVMGPDGKVWLAQWTPSLTAVDAGEVVAVQHANVANTVRFAASGWEPVVRMVRSLDVAKQLILTMFPNSEIIWEDEQGCR